MTTPRATSQRSPVFARLFLLVALIVASSTSALAVALGATKAEVIAELGQPTAQALREHVEILTYPKGVRVTLEDGHVVSAQKLQLTVEETPEPLDAEPTPVPTKKPRPTVTPTPTPKPTLEPEIQAIQAMTAPPTEQTRAIREKLSTTQNRLIEAETHTTDDLPIFGKVLLLGTHLVLTLIALLISFRVWGMNSTNGGIFAIALIDLLFHVVFQALGPITSGISTMAAVEYGIPGIVMVFTVNHYCFTKNLQDAVRTAGLVKIVVALLRLVVAAALMKQTFHL